MSNLTITIKDVTIVTLNETDLVEDMVEQVLSTPKREISHSNGLQWWVDYSPSGMTREYHDCVSMFLVVNKPVKAKLCFEVDTLSAATCTHEFTEPLNDWGYMKFRGHERLRPLFRDGKLTVRCTVEFDILAPFSPSFARNYLLFQHVPTDVEFVVGSGRVPVHKYFLLLISPVFNAMFAHDTVESKSGTIKILDFDFDTVKAAIDLCYGRDLDHLSAETAVNIMRFCDKYFITAVIDELEKLPLLTPSITSFCPIAQYSYDCNRDKLLADCCQFFKEHQDEIKALNIIADLSPGLTVVLLKSVFGLKTIFDVLHFAHENSMEAVVNHLEQGLLVGLTVDNFCLAVSYAYDYSHEDLKKACAHFFVDNRLEFYKILKDIDELPEIVHKVLKACQFE